MLVKYHAVQSRCNECIITLAHFYNKIIWVYFWEISFKMWKKLTFDHKEERLRREIFVPWRAFQKIWVDWAGVALMGGFFASPSIQHTQHRTAQHMSDQKRCFWQFSPASQGTRPNVYHIIMWSLIWKSATDSGQVYLYYFIYSPWVKLKFREMEDEKRKLNPMKWIGMTSTSTYMHSCNVS